MTLLYLEGSCMVIWPGRRILLFPLTDICSCCKLYTAIFCCIATPFCITCLKYFESIRKLCSFRNFRVNIYERYESYEAWLTNVRHQITNPVWKNLARFWFHTSREVSLACNVAMRPTLLWPPVFLATSWRHNDGVLAFSQFTQRFTKTAFNTVLEVAHHDDHGIIWKRLRLQSC